MNAPLPAAYCIADSRTADVLPLKSSSPEYVAWIVFGKPGVVEVSEHSPAAMPSEQLSVPSVTVTVPVAETAKARKVEITSGAKAEITA